jgi:hypothetical protein
MTATYPAAVKSFTPKVNVVDLIQAADPNSLFDEVTAIESVIGTTPSVATAATASGWANTATDYTTINARLANIEKGVIADTHTQYVKVAGGSTITASAAGVTGLIVQGASGQTANLMEWKNNAGTVMAKIDPAGNFTAINIAGGGTSGVDTVLLLGGM